MDSESEQITTDVIIGEGNLTGKGVYAGRDFTSGEVVIKYHLTPLTQEEFDALPESEKVFTHIHHGVIDLYGEPERYVNDADDPNTLPDHEIQADVAVRDIKKGEMITTNSSLADTIRNLVKFSLRA